MTLQELIDWAVKIPDCSGTVSIGRDEFYGLQHGLEGQDHGYTARIMVKGVPFSGMANSPDGAIEKLGEKMLSKFKS